MGRGPRPHSALQDWAVRCLEEQTAGECHDCLLGAMKPQDDSHVTPIAFQTGRGLSQGTPHHPWTPVCGGQQAGHEDGPGLQDYPPLGHQKSRSRLVNRMQPVDYGSNPRLIANLRLLCLDILKQTSNEPTRHWDGFDFPPQSGAAVQPLS